MPMLVLTGEKASGEFLITQASSWTIMSRASLFRARPLADGRSARVVIPKLVAFFAT